MVEWFVHCVYCHRRCCWSCSVLLLLLLLTSSSSFLYLRSSCDGWPEKTGVNELPCDGATQYGDSVIMAVQTNVSRLWPHNGSIQWSAVPLDPVPVSIPNSPVITNGSDVVVITNTYPFTSLPVIGLAPGNGSSLWAYYNTSYGTCSPVGAPVAGFADALYVTCNMGTAKEPVYAILALDGATGRPRWPRPYVMSGRRRVVGTRACVVVAVVLLPRVAVCLDCCVDLWSPATERFCLCLCQFVSPADIAVYRCSCGWSCQWG